MVEVVYKANDIQAVADFLHSKGSSIGFVPTMGALHSGHASLIKQAVAECSAATCSIFVNPTQFNDKNDFARYPRTFEQDVKILNEAGCHYLFLPTVDEIYPDESYKTINFTPGIIGDVLEGKFRPGHFAGMAKMICTMKKGMLPPNYLTTNGNTLPAYCSA